MLITSIYQNTISLSVLQVTENRMIRKIGSMSKTSSTASSTLSVNALTLDGSDPLTHFAEMDNADPLSKIVIENVTFFSIN